MPLANPDVLRTGYHAEAENRVFVYASAAAAAFFLSGNLVGILGIDGAALCYLLLMAGETAGFGLCTVKSCRSEEKEIRQ